MLIIYYREETESAWEMRDSCSDSFSEESESEKLSRSDGGSSEEGLFEQDNQLQMNNRLGYLYYQYFERSSPYGRVPLVDKVSCLFKYTSFFSTSKNFFVIVEYNIDSANSYSSASDNFFNPKFVVLASNSCMIEV